MSKSLIRKNQLDPDISDLISGYGNNFFVSPSEVNVIVSENISNIGNVVYATGNQAISGIKVFGINNTVVEKSFVSTIFGGENNSISGDSRALTGSRYSYINNGRENNMYSTAYSFISNGYKNLVYGTHNSFIFNGDENIIHTTVRSIIGNGCSNLITGGSEGSIILGGSLNSINRSVESFIGNGVSHSMGIGNSEEIL